MGVVVFWEGEEGEYYCCCCYEGICWRDFDCLWVLGFVNFKFWFGIVELRGRGEGLLRFIVWEVFFLMLEFWCFLWIVVGFIGLFMVCLLLCLGRIFSSMGWICLCLMCMGVFFLCKLLWRVWCYGFWIWCWVVFCLFFFVVLIDSEVIVVCWWRGGDNWCFVVEGFVEIFCWFNFEFRWDLGYIFDEVICFLIVGSK